MAEKIITSRKVSFIGWIIFSLFGLCVSPAIAGKPQFANKYDALWYKINWHDIYVRQVTGCPTLKINGYWPFMKLGKTPNWHDNDKRWASYEKAGDRGAKDGKKAAATYIKKNGIENYCQHLVKKYGPESTIIYAIKSVSLEEKAGLRDTNLSGCKTINDTVFFNWTCDLDPDAYPEICEAKKKKLVKKLSCRAGLRVLKDKLELTGKKHDEVWHKEFTGLKSSGPFFQIQDQAGDLFWVSEFDWEYATERVKK